MNSKTLPFFFCLSIFAASCVQTTKETDPTNAKPDLYAEITGSSAKYDSILAQKMDADEYGMHRYVMAFLKKGPNRDLDSITAANLQKAHLENIVKMGEAGKLVLVGPFIDTGEVRGIYIFKVATVEEARALTATDPAIQAGSLIMELRPWYGSAALPLITPLHKRVEKTSVAK
ncbi:MAG: YciI family protein [Saprospiraceae bacterium]